jgi:uncharacterized protein YjbI with pentapeptide repeats
MLAVGAVFYDWREKRRDDKLQESEQQRQQLVIWEQTQAAALQAYLDHMSDLLVHQQLRTCDRSSDTCRLAEARTLTVLLNLDGFRKRHPLKLIARLDLINKNAPLLSLKNAGLDGADLHEITLLNVSLREADLRGADLTGADLSESDLRGADLRGADLTRAVLTHACLAHANLLPYDRLNPAQLNAPHLRNGSDPSHVDEGRRLKPATFSDRHLTLTELDEADLQGADLRAAFLYKANLSNANLDGAVLIDTDLRRADLSGASLNNTDLGGADLTDARITSEQLSTCKAYDGATMPDGSKHD